jgi:acyl-CoA thioesterase FadM
MEVKYRRPLRLGERVIVAAQLTRSRGRWLEVKGEMRDAAGNLLAQSKGVFVRLPREEARALEAFYVTGAGAPSAVGDESAGP